MDNFIRALVLLIFTSIGSGNLLADADHESHPEHSKTQWQDLSKAQQDWLADFKQQWNELHPHHQRRLLKSSKRWESATPEQRAMMKERRKHWKSKNLEDKRHLRKRFDDFKKLPKEKQHSLRKAYHLFRQLSDSQRKLLRNHWKDMSPSERRDKKEIFLKMSKEERIHYLENLQAKPVDG